MNRPRIFVAIPAYRDRECQWTLRDMFERARHPERVFAGVCWQTVPETDADCFLIRPRPDQVRAVAFHAREAQGLGWARSQAQTLWRGEEYTLQIDSHMRFADDWDERMIEMLGLCDSPDPVLTQYPAAYEPPDTRLPFDRPRVQMIRGFMPSGLMDFGLERVPADVVADRPMPTAAVAGGFIFGSSRMLRDVPSDPEIYFNGEEPNLAVRLWTAGFDLFSPHETLIYHYYERKDGPRHWNDAAPRAAVAPTEHTWRRLRLLCEPEAFSPEEVAELGRYGLGSRRGLDEYQLFAGVNFAARSVAVEARRHPWVRPRSVREALALPDTLRPAPGTHLFVLGDTGVLFAAAEGKLHRLNQAATFAWCALEAGWSWRRIIAEAAGAREIPEATALAELRELAAHWTGEGLLRDTALEPPAGPWADPASRVFRDHDYRLMDTVLRLRFGDAALEALIQPAFAHLAIEPPGVAPDATLSVFRILDRYVHLRRGGEAASRPVAAATRAETEDGGDGAGDRATAANPASAFGGGDARRPADPAAGPRRQRQDVADRAVAGDGLRVFLRRGGVAAPGRAGATDPDRSVGEGRRRAAPGTALPRTCGFARA